MRRRAWPVRVTKMPVPTRTSTSPPISSEMIASRTDVRETPSSAASSRSAGSREPRANSPLAISPRDLLGDLAIQAVGLDGLQRQGDSSEAPGDSAAHRRRAVQVAGALGMLAQHRSVVYTLVKWSNHRTNDLRLRPTALRDRSVAPMPLRLQPTSDRRTMP